MRHDVALALVGLATAIAIAAALAGLLTGSRLYDRAHLLSPVTSLAAPLLGIGLAIQDGVGLASGEILLTCALVALTGPVFTVVTARLVAQNEGRVAGTLEDGEDRQ
ncbi:MAG: monovalent cation/H(+) antiporter subunit G [Actinomycetota bacterium]|nr:monovalent cation/H(+) antiporter subunit G [Actinomycetota bacterium]